MGQGGFGAAIFTAGLVALRSCRRARRPPASPNTGSRRRRLKGRKRDRRPEPRHRRPSRGCRSRATGSGGLVYVKNVGGTPRVFVSRLLGGFFGRPQQIDASLPGASSQPVIAAGNGGVLQVAFISGGGLYVVQSLGSSQALSAPGLFSGAASNPSIQMSNFGKAYLAFTVADGAGHDVRAAYFNKSTWALEAAALNVTPGDDAGTGTGRPQVAPPAMESGSSPGARVVTCTRDACGAYRPASSPSGPTAPLRAAPSSRPGTRRSGSRATPPTSRSPFRRR